MNSHPQAFTMDPKATSIYASPKEVAGKIAARTGGSPSTISVQMVGSREVEKFISRVLKAKKNIRKVKLQLD